MGPPDPDRTIDHGPDQWTMSTPIGAVKSHKKSSNQSSKVTQGTKKQLKSHYYDFNLITLLL